MILISCRKPFHNSSSCYVVWGGGEKDSPLPDSGARRQDKTPDEVSAAILGDAVAENEKITRSVAIGCIALVRIFFYSKTLEHQNDYCINS